MSVKPYCIFRRGNSPVVAAAIHNGHDTRPAIEKHLAIDEAQRLREEDPFTGEWTQIAKTQIIGLRSRFEVDLNRPRSAAIYTTPEEAWGLRVWSTPPGRRMIERSLHEYDDFYRMARLLLRELVEEHRRVVLYDLHTYNHRRNGAAADPVANPDVNVGTGTMERGYWAPVVERFIGELRNCDYSGRPLDVRENVKFRGGHFGRWVHQNFPRQVCSIAIEVKKFFMDEREQTADPGAVEQVYEALRATLPGVQKELMRL